MTTFVHDLIDQSVINQPNKPALIYKSQSISYKALAEQVATIASSLQSLAIQRHDRIGIYLHKTVETVTTIFACSQSSAVFVPINPSLKAPQVQHIVNDCDIQILVTNRGRYNALKPILNELTSIKHIILIDGKAADTIIEDNIQVHPWADFLAKATQEHILSPLTGNDMAAILYTSGSTGKPKGVVLSHSNIVLGAKSVAEYLHNTADDTILAVLPLSFDYGLSQITTSFLVGASCVLLDYLLPNDVIKTIDKYKVTGLAAVPPLWSQLCNLNWPENSAKSIRYFTNSGGALSTTNLSTLRKLMPQASPFLMYGLTEAFRSTYLPPSEIDKRIGSMGKAIPNAEILIVRKDGSECNVNEPGELVHKGPLVALGYWNAIEKTAKRFKAAPQKPSGIMLNEIAVWSGDTVQKDEDGFLYFVARQDDMIKTSGYRVSPMEIEEILYQHNDVAEAATMGVTHDDLGQAIIAVVCSNSSDDFNEIEKSIVKHCQKQLANYMVPKKIIVLKQLPHNANGKIDRSLLSATYKNYFME
ncbi:acyl-CoA ligase (AMP-forming), exosortase A system-associated [Colwelliaceae bacterium 6441]